MSFIPKPHEIYKHFKGNLYQITAIAEHTETGETLVVYQAMYGDFKTYARPLAMFVSPVDREKYPGAAQEFRFELQGPDAARQKAEMDAYSQAESAAFGMAASADGLVQAESAGQPGRLKPDRLSGQGRMESAGQLGQAQLESAGQLGQAQLESAGQPVRAQLESAGQPVRAQLESAGQPGQAQPEPSEETGEINIDPLVLEFLDADSYEQRLNILAALHHRITDDMITTMAIACDVEIEDGDIEGRYESLKTCLLTLDRYECSRLR